MLQAQLSPYAGKVILAATPIGNVDDASARLREALETASLIAAEDTRRLYNLAGRLGVKIVGRVLSLHEHNETARLDQLLDAARAGQDVLVVTDAGMPTVSDPGYRLAAAAIDVQITVTSLPGPSAVTTALAVSGLPTDRFCFEGFLPRKTGALAAALHELSTEARTMVFFEAPRRVHDTLKAMSEHFGSSRPATLCRELTKIHEEVIRTTVGELVELTAGEVLGEICLVVAGAPARTTNVEQLVERVNQLAAEGVRLKSAAKMVAKDHQVSANQLYQAALEAQL